MKPLTKLTKREIQVLALVAEGYNNREIATRLIITVITVQNHLRTIFQKLDVSNRTAAARCWWNIEQSSPASQND